MKKWTLLSLLALASYPAYSLPLGNPALPTLFMDECCDQNENSCRWWDCLGIDCLGVGYYGDFVFQRYLENAVSSAVVHDTTITTNAGQLTLNFFDWLDIFGTIGATNINLQAYGTVLNARSAGPSNDYKRLYTVDFNDSFSWSVGARATLWECKCFGLGVEGQYFTSNQDFNYVTDGGSYLEYRDNLSMRYQEWQVGLGAYYMMNFDCYQVSTIVPYLGVKYAHAHFDTGSAFIRTFNNNMSTLSVTFNDFDSEKDIGYVIGTTLTFCHKYSVTVEGRFRDENALYVSGQFCF